MKKIKDFKHLEKVIKNHVYYVITRPKFLDWNPFIRSAFLVILSITIVPIIDLWYKERFKRLDLTKYNISNIEIVKVPGIRTNVLGSYMSGPFYRFSIKNTPNARHLEEWLFLYVIFNKDPEINKTIQKMFTSNS